MREIPPPHRDPLLHCRLRSVASYCAVPSFQLIGKKDINMAKATCAKTTYVIRGMYINALGWAIGLMFFPQHVYSFFPFTNSFMSQAMSAGGLMSSWWAGANALIVSMLFMAAAQGTPAHQKKAVQYGVIPYGAMFVWGVFRQAPHITDMRYNYGLYAYGASMVLHGIFVAYGEYISKSCKGFFKKSTTSKKSSTTTRKSPRRTPARASKKSD